ncbi:helix-turn-helix domain-containing protein [Nocardiaceae bacterium NPDC056970]
MIAKTGAAPQAFTVADGAARLGQTEAWYLRQLRGRHLPGHKIGRKWMLTEDDIRQALELTAIAATPRMPDPAGLTPTSRRRANRRAA